MKLFVIGAGCSKAFDQSHSGQRMPVSKDFFKVLNNLPNLNQNQWVLVGSLVVGMKELLGRPEIDPFKDDFDIEEIHSLIEEMLFKAIADQDFAGKHHYFKVYTQLIFLFSCLVNEVAQGPVSKAHINLTKFIANDDVVMTFNWDTLLERAMSEHTSWKSSYGYYVRPSGIYNNGWMKNESNIVNHGPILLKMHGSSNWLTGSITIDPDENEFSSLQEENTDKFFVYEHSDGPYSCYDGRWEKVYCPYTCGYYPPNLPIKSKPPEDGMRRFKFTMRGGPFPPKGKYESSGLTSMPLIIPPVKYKSYKFFGKLFDEIWARAEQAIVEAESITFIGYSFPLTDKKSVELFKKALCKRNAIPVVNIIDPAPQRIADLMKYELGISEDKLNVYNQYFSSMTDLNEIINKIK